MGHCFPIKKAGRQDFMHIIALLSIKKTLKIGKQCEAHDILPMMLQSADISFPNTENSMNRPSRAVIFNPCLNMYVYVTGGMDPSGEMDLNNEYSFYLNTVKKFNVRISNPIIFAVQFRVRHFFFKF